MHSSIIKVKNAFNESETEACIIIENNINYVPKVSVIIPVYNTEEYLCKCLDSIIGQTLKEIEIICIDDGSTDKSLDIIKDYARKDKRITVISQKNLHAGVARNVGISVSKGEYIHFLDSDDWLDINSYKCMYDIITNINVDIVKFRSYSFDNENNKIVNRYFTNMGAINKKYFYKKLNFNDDYEIMIHISDAPWSGIYNRKFIIDNNILFDNLLCSNDVTFFYKCILKCNYVYLTEKRFVYYRINNNKSLIGIRKDHFNCQIITFFRIIKMIEDKNINIKKCIRKHLIESIFFRYDNYLKESHEKDKIVNEMKILVKHINDDEVMSKYKCLFYSLKYDICISIIIPVYNSSQYIEECLTSIINQSMKNIEIICIDDCSTDHSFSILKKYEKLDSRIKIVKNEKNIGPAGSRNIGISMAKGHYIGFVDSDDYISSDYFENLYLSAIEHNADIASTSNVIRVPSYDKKNMGITQDISTINDKYKMIISTGVCWNKIYNNNFINKNNIHFPFGFKYGEDNLFVFTSIMYSNYISYTNKSIYYYRENKSSIILSKKDERCFDMIDVYYLIYNEIQNLKFEKEKNIYLNCLYDRVKKDCTGTYFLLPENLRSTFSKKYHELFPTVEPLPEFPDVIISLTSYPLRINTVSYTIKSLLKQDCHYKKIILWLAKEQFPQGEKELPTDLTDLISDSFCIEWCTDLRSYKKLIPALKKYPDDIIVTADDDIIYPRDWLRRLVHAYSEHPDMIHCLRAHRIVIHNGNILPYQRWNVKEYNVSPSFLNFFTGVGGVVYHSSLLYRDVMREDIFTKICPDADDIWFWE